jgi:hypothetical protein
MGLLTAAAILAAKDLKPVTVAVPEWGGDVLVRGLRSAERDAFETAMFKTEGGVRVLHTQNARARLVVLCCVDEKGERIFTDDDADALGAQSAVALDRVYTAAARLSGLAAGKAEDAKNA